LEFVDFTVNKRYYGIICHKCVLFIVHFKYFADNTRLPKDKASEPRVYGEGFTMIARLPEQVVVKAIL